MRKTVVGAVAVLACAGVVVGAGSVLAGEGGTGPGQTPDPAEVRKVRAEAVSAPSAARAVATPLASRKAKAKKRKPELVYLETQPQTLVAGPTGFRIGNCPKRSSAINGYYYLAGTQAGFGLDNQGDSPIKGLRQWAFYLDSPSGASGVTFGLVCLKNVKVR
jgi:hypothetical protein